MYIRTISSECDRFRDADFLLMNFASNSALYAKLFSCPTECGEAKDCLDAELDSACYIESQKSGKINTLLKKRSLSSRLIMIEMVFTKGILMICKNKNFLFQQTT